MSEEIFRKKSMDKMKSPEALDDYIRVANPGVWLLLFSVIILLVGACVWGIFGSVDSVVAAHVRVEDGAAVCYVAQADISSVREGMSVRFHGGDAVITEIGPKGEEGFVCPLQGEQSAADGVYDGEIVIRSVRPLSFILN